MCRTPLQGADSGGNMTGRAPHPQSCMSGGSWTRVSEGRSALCCHAERQDRAGNTHFGASCRATQKLHNLISDGNRRPLFSQSQESHDLSLPLLSVLQASCTGRLGDVSGSPGKLLCIPQSPLTDLSRYHLPPPALTSTRDDVLFSLCLALVGSLPAPPGEDNNALSGGGCEHYIRQYPF